MYDETPEERPIAEVRWQTRVDLAAAHRLAAMEGFSEGIFNHLTCRVPGHDDRYYQMPFGLHWSEVTAGCFMEIGYDGTQHAGSGIIEQSCFLIHAPIHRLAPQAGAVFHTHMPFASALTRLENPEILPIGQMELLIANLTAYDYNYDGPAFSDSEGERLTAALGDKKILMMSNHGVVTAAPTVAEAYNLLYYLERVAQVQVYAMWTGRPLKTLPQAIVDESKARLGSRRYGDKDHSYWHFEAMKRVLDRKEPDYKT